jgi:hypothetical protein
MPAQRHCNEFNIHHRCAFFNGLETEVGLAAAKAAAWRINLNESAMA